MPSSFPCLSHPVKWSLSVDCASVQFLTCLRCYHFLSLLVDICVHVSVWRITNCIPMVSFGGNGFPICNVKKFDIIETLSLLV